MNRGRAISAGLLAGTLAGLVMTVVMLLLAWLFGVATSLAIFGDRLSVFIPADTLLSLMSRVGGYNHMKQLGVSSHVKWITRVEVADANATGFYEAQGWGPRRNQFRRRRKLAGNET
jgi:hypothetical protein